MYEITLTTKQRKIAAAALFHQIKALEAELPSGLRDRRLKDAQELQEVLVPTQVYDCRDETYAGDGITLHGLGIND